MNDGGNVLLCPINGVRKTGDENDHSFVIGRVDLLDQFFILERDGLAVNGFSMSVSRLA